MGRQHPWVNSTTAPAPHRHGISSCIPCPVSLPPAAQSCLPILRVSVSHHQLLTSILQAWRGGTRPQLVPTWPHQLPWQLGSGSVSSSAALCSVLGLQECQSCGHKGPLCKWGSVAQPSIPNRGCGGTQLRAHAWAAADTSMASQLPARLCGVPAAARAVRKESPLPIPLAPPAPAAG